MQVFDGQPTNAAPRVAVVVVNYNGTDDTHRCLGSLRNLDHPNVEVVLVDNGSSPPAGAEFEAAYPWVRVIQNPVNGGWAGGNNVGVRDALARGADYLVLLNNDTIVAPNLVTRLLAALASGYDVVGPLVHWMDEPDAVMMDGCWFEAPHGGGFFERVPVTAEAGAVADVEIVYGCCLTTSAEVFRRVGLLDERFFLIHEESDFCLRAGRAGLRCGVLAEPLVWHKGSSTFQREPRPLQCYFDARNLFLLLWKHAGAYGHPPGRLRLWRKYLRWVYHSYCTCRDGGNDAGARAVVSGFHDALFRNFGPMRDRRRPLAPLLAWAFERWRTRKGQPNER